MNKRYKRLIRQLDPINTIEYTKEYSKNSILFNRLCSEIQKKLPEDDKMLMYMLTYYRLMAEKSAVEHMFEEGFLMGIRLRSKKHRRRLCHKK